MVGDSKILTVSYGTFSCTLEGFDDPFSMMKAITEYFRDLAAQDRYFGAEPPSPDAAMLHRIAEREVHRMVDVRISDTSVMLRDQGAVSETAAPGTAAPEVAPGSAPNSEGAALLAAIPGGVAAKLARVRQSVDGAITTAGTDLPDTGPDTGPDTDPDTGPALDPANDRVGASSQLPEMDLSPAPLAADPARMPPLEALLKLHGQNTVALDDWEQADVGEADDVRNRLERLLAADAEPTVAVVDPDAGAVEAAAEVSPALALADSAAMDVTESATENRPEIAPETSGDFALDHNLEATLRAIVDAEDDSALPQEAGAEMEGLTEAPDTSTLEASAIGTADLDGPEPMATPMATPMAAPMDPAADAAYLSPGSDAEPALEADTQPGPTLTTEAEGEREAEPIADIGADLSAVGASDPADAEPAQDAEIAFPSPDDLNRAPEGEIQTPIADGDAEVATAPRRDRKRRMEKANEDAMSRLMRHADDEMAGAESRRRLSAIAHLKAAVAATEAERMVTGEAMSDPVAKAEPYREDLAHAVQPLTQTPAKLAADLDTGASLTARPRRTVSSKRPLLSQDDLPRPGTLRLSGMFPPPLVLVSAQRIDQPFPSGQPPVGQRSGRLTGVIGASAVQHDGLSAANENRFAADTDDEDADDADNIFSDDAGFAEFAEKLGAVSLTELMEAAAAFTTCVENRDHFTRPQLTRRLKVTNAGEPINREDGLRSFGTLLRSGRILKVRSGHYRLSPSSPYLIDARRYAQ